MFMEIEAEKIPEKGNFFFFWERAQRETLLNLIQEFVFYVKSVLLP